MIRLRPEGPGPLAGGVGDEFVDGATPGVLLGQLGDDITDGQNADRGQEHDQGSDAAGKAGKCTTNGGDRENWSHCERLRDAVERAEFGATGQRWCVDAFQVFPRTLSPRAIRDRSVPYNLRPIVSRSADTL